MTPNKGWFTYSKLCSRHYGKAYCLSYFFVILAYWYTIESVRKQNTFKYILAETIVILVDVRVLQIDLGRVMDDYMEQGFPVNPICNIVEKLVWSIQGH